MILSKSTAYGIRALAYLANHPDRICTLHEIAERLSVPEVYLGKILCELRRRRLVVSAKGIHGGYRLGQQAEEISFLDVFSILEPNPYMDMCILARGVCRPENACSVHFDWQDLRRSILAFLERKRISQVVESESGEQNQS